MHKLLKGLTDFEQNFFTYSQEECDCKKLDFVKMFVSTVIIQNQNSRLSVRKEMIAISPITSLTDVSLRMKPRNMYFKRFPVVLFQSLA